MKKLADAREPHRCLLILDNVDRPSLLGPTQVARLSGGDWLHVLATTRLGENELYGSHRDRSFLAVDELPPEDALALIESYQPNGHFHGEADRDAAREIVQLLGCFTLAVESAAVYLGQFANDVTCAAFFARLRKEGLVGLDAAASQSSEGVLHGEKRLSATLQPTLERLGAAEKLALEFAALLPPDQVALPWLRSLVAKTFPETERDAEPGYPDPWKNVVRRLISLRLLQATDVVDADRQPRVVRVHRLVQELVRAKSEEEVKQRHGALVAHAFERSEEIEKHWYEPDCQWEIAPLLAFLDQLLDSKDSEAPRLVKWVFQWLGYFGTAMSPEPLLRRALAQQEADTNTEPTEMAITLSNLGLVLKWQARYAEAESLLRKALLCDEEHRERTHPFIAIRLNNLALLLQDTNRLAEAEPLMRRALAINQESFGPDHPAVANSLSSLASLLRELNRLAEAEPLMRRALAIREDSFGANHPDVAISLNNLGRLLQATNRLDEAEPLTRRALAIWEKSLGADHPHVAIALDNLGRLLQATNRLDEAEPLMRRALAIHERALVPDHPDIFQSVEILAALLEATGRFEEAAPLRRRIMEHKLGPEHPDTLRGWNNHTIGLRKQGKAGLAEPIARRVAAITAKTLGDTHPLTIHRRNNLVLTLIMLGKLDEARQVLAANWHLDAPPYANTTPRIAFLRKVIAMLEEQPITPFLGQLKTLITGPELPVSPEVAVPWDIAYFIEHLRPKLQPGSAEFLTAVLAALDERKKLADLDRFPEWRNQAHIPLDTPWPNEPADHETIEAIA